MILLSFSKILNVQALFKLRKTYSNLKNSTALRSKAASVKNESCSFRISKNVSSQPLKYYDLLTGVPYKSYGLKPAKILN